MKFLLRFQSKQGITLTGMHSFFCFDFYLAFYKQVVFRPHLVICEFKTHPNWPFFTRADSQWTNLSYTCNGDAWFACLILFGLLIVSPLNTFFSLSNAI